MTIETVFVNSATGISETVLPFLYTPQESLTIAILNGKRICNLFFKDIIVVEDKYFRLRRKITFDYHKEEQPCQPISQGAPTLFDGQKP